MTWIKLEVHQSRTCIPRYYKFACYTCDSKPITRTLKGGRFGLTATLGDRKRWILKFGSKCSRPPLFYALSSPICPRATQDFFSSPPTLQFGFLYIPIHKSSGSTVFSHPGIAHPGTRIRIAPLRRLLIPSSLGHSTWAVRLSATSHLLVQHPN